MISDQLKEAKQKMEMAADHVGNEFSTVRTGRANPQLLHRITVDYYGTPTPLQQLASISVPEPRLLMVQPFDASTLVQPSGTLRGHFSKPTSGSTLPMTGPSSGSLFHLSPKSVVRS